MALGNSRPRNGGRDFQHGVLAMELARHQLIYRVTPTRRSAMKTLWFTGSNEEVTLPYVQSYCLLVHERRGRWKAVAHWDGRLLASGSSVVDVVGKVLRYVYGKPAPWPLDDMGDSDDSSAGDAAVGH